MSYDVKPFFPPVLLSVYRSCHFELSQDTNCEQFANKML